MDIILEKWDEILFTVKREYDISDIAFNAFIRPLEVCGAADGVLYILVPDEHLGLNYITKKFYLPIKVAVAEIIGREYEIEFVLPEQAKKMRSARGKVKKAAFAEKTGNTGNKGTDGSYLNRNYTFENFVVGSNNRFAYSASLAVAESPGETYNPLYIYGDPGLGKTHLMQSIGHFVRASNPAAKIIYVTSEEFTNEVIESIRSGNAAKMNKLREKYRTIDVLMIDDIQFIIGKESTQEEFFHTFNALHSSGKQIVITSDKPPKEMETLEERIRSRFEWGLMADIGKPDYETRMAILRKKSEDDGLILSDDILNYIATNIKYNIRELEGALNKLLAISNLEDSEITMDVAVKELSSIITPQAARQITVPLVIEVVAEHFHVSVDQILSKSRSGSIVRPRQIAMYLCKTMTDIPLDSIGQQMGGRDHSTIIHGANKIAEEYSSNEDTRKLIDTIKKKINPN